MITKKTTYIAYEDETGTQIAEHQYTQRVSKLKRGFRLMYHKEIKNVILSLSGKTNSMKLMFILSDHIDSTGLIKISRKEIMEEYNFSKSQLSKSFKELWHEKVVSDTKGSIYLNPFMFVPPNNPHIKDSSALAQQQWEKEIGHYGN